MAPLAFEAYVNETYSIGSIHLAGEETERRRYKIEVGDLVMMGEEE